LKGQGPRTRGYVRGCSTGLVTLTGRGLGKGSTPFC